MERRGGRGREEGREGGGGEEEREYMYCTCTHYMVRSHLCCMCMTCDTHTPGHPSAADEVWYWLKHILHIG